MLSGLFADRSPYRKFLIVVGLVAVSTLVFMMIGALLVELLYGVKILSDPSALSDLDNPTTLAAMKLMQLLSTGIGMFLLPSIILAWLFSPEPATYLSLKTEPEGSIMVLTVLIMLTSVPIINVMLMWNQEMQLPSFLEGVEKWMRTSEDHAAKLTEALLNMPTAGDMFYNLLIVALLPALGEEFLFRGILQKLFKELTNNIHTSIILTAIIFSAIHMQFYGFLPRMMLGMLFGYLLHWSGSIWVPVLAHFVNNGAAVVFAYVAGIKELPINQDTIGTMEGEWIWVVISAVILTLSLYGVWKVGGQSAVGSQRWVVSGRR